MKCPKCGNECTADYVDNGVGMQRCGPYVCLPEDGGCGWIEDDVLLSDNNDCTATQSKTATPKSPDGDFVQS